MATAGPTMENIETIKNAINQGVKSFRINLGLKQRNLTGYFKNIRQAELELNKKVKVLIDLPSSRPRIGEIKEAIQYNSGDIINIVDVKSSNDKKILPLPGMKNITKFIKNDDRIFFKDGKVEFKVLEVISSTNLLVKCIAATTEVRTFGSSSFPDSNILYNPILESDIKLLNKFRDDLLVPDYICVSFASTPKQMIHVKNQIENIFGDYKIKYIAKIETRNGVRDINSILKVCDGLMVGRGDLLQNIEAHELPKIQEHLVFSAKKEKKISVVATEMFEQFAIKGVANRAELSDIALAVRQGSSYVMLSMETGNSNHPIETVQLIKKVIDAENTIHF